MTDQNVSLSPRLSAWRPSERNYEASQSDVGLKSSYLDTSAAMDRRGELMEASSSLPEPDLPSMATGKNLDYGAQFDVREAAAFNLGLELFDRDFGAVAGLVQRKVRHFLGSLAPWAQGAKEVEGRHADVMREMRATCLIANASIDVLLGVGRAWWTISVSRALLCECRDAERTGTDLPTARF